MYWPHDFFALQHVFLRIEASRSKQTVRFENLVRFIDYFTICFKDCYIVYFMDCFKDLNWEEKLPRFLFLFLISFITYALLYPPRGIITITTRTTTNYALQAQGYVLLFLQPSPQDPFFILFCLLKPSNLYLSFPASLLHPHSS